MDHNNGWETAINPKNRNNLGEMRFHICDKEKALDKRWTIEFQIADFPRSDGTHNIPFFSKLTLREEARDIEAMEFDIKIRFIKLTRIAQVSHKMKNAV